MVAFTKGHAVFNYRVAGVAVHNGKVLLDRNTKNNYWVLPGGHPEMMEPMDEALRREVFEEVGEDVKVIRLLWILENFFQKNKDIHELSFYFLMELAPDSRLLREEGPYEGYEHNQKLIFNWFAPDEATMRSLPLFPTVLANQLFQLPATPQHLVFQDVQTKEEGKKKSNPSSAVLFPLSDSRHPQQ
jgi:8-oxo-dGTP pyrophosphatase MutT (NUDIX family)